MNSCLNYYQEDKLHWRQFFRQLSCQSMLINVKFYIKRTVNLNHVKTQIPVNVEDKSNYPIFSDHITYREKDTHNQGVAGSSPAGPT